MMTMDKKELERLTADAELWESGKLGRSAKHIRIASDDEELAIDDALGLQLISIRLHKSLIEKLKQLALLEGIGYQPLIRQVLTRYLRENEYKLDTLLSAAEAAERADAQFVLAIRLKEKISRLPPLSNDRIDAESEYSRCLGHAQTLFTLAFQSTSSAVLKQHCTLRTNQIKALCPEEETLPESSKGNKKPLKKPVKKPAQRSGAKSR
jgi:hypothetical protein